MKFQVNGKKHDVDVPPMKRLLDVIRDDVGLTGTKEGCGEGECGACSVLLDGEMVNSCLVPACQAEGAKILTVEGIASAGKKGSEGVLHPIQEAFWIYGGAQCGICTPGMLIASLELLSRKKLTEADVREGLAGNLCRCTGYVKIVEAVLAAHKHVTAGRGARPMPEPLAAERRPRSRKVRRAR